MWHNYSRTPDIIIDFATIMTKPCFNAYMYTTLEYYVDSAKSPHFGIAVYAICIYFFMAIFFSILTIGEYKIEFGLSSGDCAVLHFSLLSYHLQTEIVRWPMMYAPRNQYIQYTQNISINKYNNNHRHKKNHNKSCRKNYVYIYTYTLTPGARIEKLFIFWSNEPIRQNNIVQINISHELSCE